MKPETYSWACADADLQREEDKLRREQYTLSSATQPKDLKPGTYMKSSFRGTEQSFDGPLNWTLTRRVHLHLHHL